MNRFFDDLGERWVAAAQRRSARIEAPSLDAKVALELPVGAIARSGVEVGDHLVIER